jgi:bacillithiol system protein YtxJ
MNWNKLEDEQQLDTAIEQSNTQPVVILKHSTRCSISAMAKSRLEREATPQGIQFYYLDLIKHRTLSNKIAEVFHVHHESPQILLLKNGACVYEESHNGINMDDIAEQALNA